MKRVTTFALFGLILLGGCKTLFEKPIHEAHAPVKGADLAAMDTRGHETAN